MVDFGRRCSVYQFDLSICVPTYNRADLIGRLLDSIPSNNRVEVVIHDDGSTDGTAAIVKGYVRLNNALVYEWKPNAGRASALREAILRARGRYVLLMDSDDYFVENGVDSVLEVIDRIDSFAAKGMNVQSAVFGVKLEKNGKETINLPPDGIVTNLLALRADLDVRKDLKELVEGRLLKECMYEVPPGIRRVPTSLLWTEVAEKTDCICVAKAVAVKEYLPGGMTDRIKSLKIQNAAPLYDLYDLISRSKRYCSVQHRFKAALLRQVYALHTGKPLAGSALQMALLPIALPLYFYQKRYR